MATQTKHYRIEFQSVHTGLWLFFLQFPSLETAKKVKKATIQATPDIRLRIREIDLLDLSILKLIEEDA